MEKQDFSRWESAPNEPTSSHWMNLATESLNRNDWEGYERCLTKYYETR